MKTKRRYLWRGVIDIFNKAAAARCRFCQVFVLQNRAPQSTQWHAMNTCGRAGFLVLALVACTATDVRAFVLSPAVPATSSTHRSPKSSIFPLPTRSTRTTSTTSSACTPRARRPAATGLICRSSPFEDLGYDDDEAARQEAQQLEDMIRGRRGIVLEAVEREWRAEMLKTVEDEGERLCDEAYEGFSTRGRGAIFVSVGCWVLGAGVCFLLRLLEERSVCRREYMSVEVCCSSLGEGGGTWLGCRAVALDLVELMLHAYHNITTYRQQSSVKHSSTCTPVASINSIYILIVEAYIWDHIYEVDYLAVTGSVYRYSVARDEIV